MGEEIKVLQFGLGPIGNKVTQYIAGRAYLEIVGGIDIDPDKVGKDVGELAGLDPVGAIVTDDAGKLLGESDAEAVVLTTTSSLESIKPQVLEIVEQKKNVISTCEELSYPWITGPEISKEIDEAARANGVTVLGTGINPGFLMDALPVALSGVCREVKSVLVERIQDAQYRRIPFQKKIGAGLTTEGFARKKEEGTLRHVGLTESIHMIASSLGWTLDKTEDIIEPIIADQTTSTDAMTIKEGDARGVCQTGRGWMNGEEVVTLVFRAAIAEPDPRDRIFISGTPDIDSTIKGGVNGDIATCAITVNAIAPTVKARPGLLTMTDMPTVCALV